MERKKKSICLVSILLFTSIFSGTQMLESNHAVPQKTIQSPAAAVADDAYEENDNAACAYPINTGFSAELELQDEDWFVIDLNIAITIIILCFLFVFREASHRLMRRPFA